MNFKKVDSNKKFPEMEEEILKFWQESKIFEKSLKNRENAPLYVFYDGPPFATGLPHHGHLLASTSKDVIPRYWTMRGCNVPRRWGWDTHGLPIENKVEQKLGYNSKKEIEENIGKFNSEAKSMVLKFADEWRKTIMRIGRWVDFDNSYKTMDSTFMESVWWAFKELHKKGLIYKDSRISLFCPHCSTPLSNFEIAMDNSYKDDKDVSVYVEMKLKGQEDTYFLVWTTTPWTLPANVALAIGKNMEYVKVRYNNEKGKPEFFILAKEIYEKRKDDLFPSAKELKELEVPPTAPEVVETINSAELVGQEYTPIFPHDIENGYRVIAGDFVTIEDGSGIVHLAPAFGEDDFQARKDNSLPMIENVDDEGKFIDGQWSGMNVWDANFKVVGFLRDNGFLFKKENIIHSYPHCYRCDAKLIYKSQPAWFIKVSQLKEKLLEQNEKINWHPAHLKEGRFKNGLETAPDWNVSRSRYWGTPIPIWECEKCGEIKVVGSYEELEKLSDKKLDDYHRPQIDEVTFACDKCGGQSNRILDVFDCWVESGSMPFAELHYPFENKELFEKRFPSQFISEYIAQTRGWFYTLHVLSVGLFEKPSFLNVVTTGTIAGNDGKKMSKSLGNFTNPNLLINRYGADAFRFYLMQSTLMEGENLNFSDKDLETIYKGMFRMLWNSYSFFVLYADIDKFVPAKDFDLKTLKNLLDRWIVSELHGLIKDFNGHMESYELHRAARLLPGFVDNLSNWYIRRSRKRFWKSEDDGDKKEAYQALHYVLVELSKIMAPFTPFITEEIYKNLTNEESVHLANFPTADELLINKELNGKMLNTRNIINEALQLRAKNKIKVRQPLSELIITNYKMQEEFIEIIKEEVNVKTVTIKSGSESKVELNTEITEDLKLEGYAREIIRFIQEMRKEAGYEVDNRIKVGHEGMDEVFDKFGQVIQKEILANDVQSASLSEKDIEKEFSIDGHRINISLKR